MESWLAFFRPEYILFLLYFFVPANVIIYGVNDYFDEETDRTNPKKNEKEHRLGGGERRDLRTLLLAVTGFSLALLPFMDTVGRLVFLGFLFLASFYSAPPLRFKEIPFLDFSSNMLYIMPGIFGLSLAAGALPPLVLVIAGYLHIAAMHLFSAIPDIDCDRRAGITTTAVLLGRKPSLLLCLGFWTLLSLLVVYLAGGHPLAFLVFCYPAIPLALLLAPSLSLEETY